ncbi:hypothetical protein GPJ56_005410 [Histomonas meleagridis]|uniref:uncharacterized protein n=1 Tax=Histomonas meleagridis TaxID=135588 RepID=UPI00355A4B26|nr:hypothetical protein GPJ56_005410 [Histomonas meleagridis]KAH0801819.1 hypothetical protein GO595_005386 [Histomonas meleagridis]
MLGVIFLGVIILTYALPWVQVGEEQYAPGQLVIPYLKYALKKIGIMKTDFNTPDSIDNIFIFEKNLRYLATPPSEGGPRNQITFELIFYAMVITIILLIVPLRITRILGYLVSLASTSAFLLAMFFLENKTIESINIGIWANLICSLVFMVITFFVK